MGIVEAIAIVDVVDNVVLVAKSHGIILASNITKSISAFHENDGIFIHNMYKWISSTEEIDERC